MAGQDNSDYPDQPTSYRPVQLSGQDNSDFPDQPQQQQQSFQPSWGQSLISMGARTIPPIAGGFAGMAGGPWGMVAGAGLGSMVGSALGQYYDTSIGLRPESTGLNWPELLTEGVIGGVTAPIGGRVPGLGASANALRKYAISAPFRTAAEGAAISGLSTYPMSVAQTGSWESPPLEAYGQNALIGGAMGGVMGGALGSYPAMRRARTAPPEPGPATDWMIPGVDTPPIPKEAQPNLPGFATFEQPTPPPPSTGQNYSLDFNRGIPFQADDLATDPAAIRPGWGPETLKSMEPVQPQRGAPGNQFGKAADGKPNVIVKTAWSPGEGKFWESHGYTAGTTPEGMPYRVHPDFPDPFKQADLGTVPTNPAQAMEMLRASVQKNAADRGIEPGLSDDVAFERFIGDEGNPARPGEVTGRVAQFDRGFIPEESQGIYDQPTDPAQLQQFARGVQGAVQPPTGDPWTDPIARVRADIGYYELELQKYREVGNTEYAANAAESLQLAKDKLAKLTGEVPVAGPGDIDPRMAQRMQGTEWDFRQSEGPVQQGLPIPLALRQQNRLAEISQAQQQTTPDPNQGNLFADITNPVRTEDFEPRFERAETYKELKEMQNAAYRRGDTNEAVRLGQIMQRMDEVANRYSVADRKKFQSRTSTPRHPWGSVGNEEPSLDKVPGGGLVISANVRNTAENITKDYTGPLSAIMSREGMQNGLDAADLLGSSGIVRVRIKDAGQDGPGTPSTIEMHDNGAGMDEHTLAQKLVHLFESGKSAQEGATGGKGIGAASYIIGGNHFEIETVAIDATDGIKYRIKAGGTKEQFLDKTKGSDWEKTPVSQSTPTGTTIRTVLKSTQTTQDARDMMDKVIEFSRDRPSRVIFDRYGIHNKGNKPSEIKYEPYMDKDIVKDTNFKSAKDDKLIGKFTVSQNEVEVLIPQSDETVKRDRVFIRYLNNGMYQFSDILRLEKSDVGVPKDILVNIHPLVDELHTDYPFINTRQALKGDELSNKIDEFLEKEIRGPAISRRKNKVQELYDSMAPITTFGTKRKSVIYDPGKRFTLQETAALQSNPVVINMIKVYDRLIDDIITSSGNTKWADRLEGVGLVFDPGMHGIHIPNPSTGKSTILINPFLRIGFVLDPRDSAFQSVGTSLHEVAHIGSETGGGLDLSSQDLSDGRLGEWFASYVAQIKKGDVGYEDTGHKLDFIQRLGEVYGKFGIQRTYDAANKLEVIFRGGSKSGGYSTEIQRLLQLHNESRGRPETTEDFLSRTGVKQSDRGRGGEGNIPSNRQTDGDGATTEGQMSPRARQIMEAARKGGRGGFEPPSRPPTDMGGEDDGSANLPMKKQPKKEDEEPSRAREWFNLPRAATTIMDLSAPLRQGLPLIFKKEWWTSWKQQIAALGSEEAYRKTLADIKSRPLFKGTDEAESLAKRAGLAIIEDTKSLTNREEGQQSNWIETGGMFAKIPGGQAAYKSTLGRAARATNRAYVAYLNQLRADTFENLMKDAQRDFLAGTKGARDPHTDLVYAKEIAAFVNTATGRGPLKVSFLGEKEHDFERNAKFLTDALFSPRLMASRVRMLSPGTYMMASPFVRKQYLKSLLAVAGASGTMSTLAAMAGADVSLDPNDADFGKIRIGNTRLDTAGGFQQYLVAASRLISGKTTSSGTGREFELGQGYRAETRKDVAERFATNKLQPVWKFAYDLAFASQYQPFHVSDRSLQMFIPLIVQDVVELVKQDPTLLPLIGPVAIGMGTQTYGKGESVGKFISPEDDWLFTGGALQNEIPNLWAPE